VGISLFPSDGHDFDSLLIRADAAMYGAKAAGKNQLRLASDSPPAPVAKVAQVAAVTGAAEDLRSAPQV
jgi:predicted signal transduction protein with EAL and GGDEF domain